MVRSRPEQWDRTVDVAVIGSGGSGLLAALRASETVDDVLVLEKANVVGGTTAVSGAGMWLPNSRPVVEAVGEKRDHKKLKTHLRRAIGERVPEDLVDAFLNTSPEVVEYMEERTGLEFQFTGYPDYHTDWPGGNEDGNMIEPTLFDGTRLGDNLDDIRDDPHHPLPTPVTDIYRNGGHAKFWENADFDDLYQKKEEGWLATGNALVAGLYEACLDADVVFELDAPANELITNGNTVVGVAAEVDDQGLLVGADSVIVAAGGMEWDEEMCENFLRGPLTAPASPPTSEGGGIRMGMDVGAKLGNTNEAWWFPTGRVPGDEWEDGSPLYRMVWGPRTLPGSIMINEAGERFCNEAGNYHDLTKTFHDFDPHEYGYENIPAYAVVDAEYRRNYRILSVSPTDDDPDWLPKADTLEGLAEQLDIDPGAFLETVEQFNEHAREGEDPEFHRGERAYDRFVGDPDAEHPNLGPVDEPPFYAIEIHPGAIGTKGGLVTNPDGRVLGVDESPIDGLYAASNSTAHVMGIGYVGAGATLGPNVVFGYRAGRSAARHAE